MASMKRLGLFAALAITLAAPSARAAIVLEEVVTTAASSSPALTPAISGGASQTYVLWVATDDDMDVTAVSGGGLTWTVREEQCGTNNKSRIELWTAQGSPGAFQVSVTWDGTRPMAAVLRIRCIMQNCESRRIVGLK